jgi:hypothetical protein
VKLPALKGVELHFSRNIVPLDYIQYPKSPVYHRDIGNIGEQRVSIPLCRDHNSALLLSPMDGSQRLFNLFRQYRSLSFKRRRDTTLLTVWVRRTPHRGSCQGVLFGCFASFPFSFCSCLLIFCFRPLSLSFLPLSPIAYPLFLCPSCSFFGSPATHTTPPGSGSTSKIPQPSN